MGAGSLAVVVIARVCAAVALGTLGFLKPALAADPVGAQIVDLGAAARHPETVSGVWEMHASDGSVIGFSVQINGTIDGDATEAAGQLVRVDGLSIIAYVSRGSDVKEAYWNDAVAGTLVWRDDRLQLRETPGSPGYLDLDLHFDTGQDTWAGTLRDAEFSGTVHLTRPDDSMADAPSGTWRQGTGPQSPDFFCTHVAIGGDGRAVFWSDSVTLGGHVDSTADHPRPERSVATFGAYADPGFATHDDDGWHFRLGNQLYGQTYTGMLSDDGSTFSGTMHHEGNGYDIGKDLPFVWQREPGGSCA